MAVQPVKDQRRKVAIGIIIVLIFAALASGVVLGAHALHIQFNPLHALPGTPFNATIAESTSFGSGSQIQHVLAMSNGYYVIGDTQSTFFPFLNGFYTFTGSYDIFIMRYDTSNNLVWSTALGGTDYDNATAAVVDSQGNLLLTGITYSIDFVGMATAGNGIGDAFVAKISPNGQLLWSKRLGGSALDFGTAITIDKTDNIIVVGDTLSADFPESKNQKVYYQGLYDQFIAKYDPNGNIVFSTLQGGTGFDDSKAVLADNSSNIYMIGMTYSNNYHLYKPYISTMRGFGDLAIVKYGANGSLLFSTFYGGSATDSFSGALISQQDLVLLGETTSVDFPLVNPAYTASQEHHSGSQAIDMFMAEFDASGTPLLSQVYGGNGTELIGDYRLLSNNTLLIGGSSNSKQLPIFGGPYTNFYRQQFATGYSTDAVLLKFNLENGRLLWGSYFIGDGSDMITHLTIGNDSSVTVVGLTNSRVFPNINGFDQQQYANNLAGITQLIYRDGILVTTLPTNGFIIKLTPDYEVAYASQFGGDQAEKIQQVLLSPKDNALIFGTSTSDNFPPVIPNSGAYHFILVVKPPSLVIDQASAASFSSQTLLIIATALIYYLILRVIYWFRKRQVIKQSEKQSSGVEMYPSLE